MARVLVVEDERVLTKILNLQLLSDGFEVISAYNGEEALNMAKEKRPDVVILDLLLPKKNGFQFLEEFKKSKENKDIPVIVLSNLDQERDILKAKELGAVDYLLKVDIESAKLGKIIRSHIDS